jgi:hypothetical protein
MAISRPSNGCRCDGAGGCTCPARACGDGVGAPMDVDPVVDVRLKDAPAASTTMQTTQQPTDSPFDVQPPEYIVARGRYQMLCLQPSPNILSVNHKVDIPSSTTPSIPVPPATRFTKPNLLNFSETINGEAISAATPPLQNSHMPCQQPPPCKHHRLAHLRVWEVGWGNVPLFFCGVLVRESPATSLPGARWGLSPGLCR